VNHPIRNFDLGQRQERPGRLVRAIRYGLALGLLATGANLAQAQSAPAPSTTSEKAAIDEGLTWHGITLYGIVDLGLQYDTHGAPFSDYYPAGSADIVQKNSRQSVTGLTPSNLSQSRVGLQGAEPLGVGDLTGIFRVETFFNPQSGDISDALKSLVQNNGRALNVQTTNLDSSIAGQAFQQSFVGFSSPTYGTLTFGRQNTVLADGIYKYDPQGASQAFSLIGLSGTTAGGGDTEDRRLDSSLKYVAQFSNVHVGAEYKFNGSRGSASTASEFSVGYEMAGASIDAYYTHINDAVSAAALSAAQVAELPGLGFSPSNSLAATISDNTTFAVMGMYGFGPVKLFAGYEHIRFENPSDPIEPGFDNIGGYKLAFVNNTAFPNDKILQVYWAGAKYNVGKLELTAAYYGYRQNSYADGANTGCTTTKASSCSGTETAVSISGVYHFTKRFDAYAGAMYTTVEDGLANAYLTRNDIDPTIGVRFRF